MTSRRRASAPSPSANSLESVGAPAARPLRGGRERRNVGERLGRGPAHVPGAEVEDRARGRVRLGEPAPRVDDEETARVRAHERLGRHGEGVGAALLRLPELLELLRALLEGVDGAREGLGRALGLVARGTGDDLGDEVAGAARRHGRSRRSGP
jgi:hypothetical protein